MVDSSADSVATVEETVTGLINQQILFRLLRSSTLTESVFV